MGQYNIDKAIGLVDNITLEGGFLSDWSKTSTDSTLATTTLIYRTANGTYPYDGLASPDAPTLVAVNALGVDKFRLQDLSIGTADAPLPTDVYPTGVGINAMRIENCNDFEIVRCRFLPGDASDGTNGENGLPGEPGSDGFDGADSDSCEVILPTNCFIPGSAGGNGGSSPASFPGGAGGNGGTSEGISLFPPQDGQDGSDAEGATVNYGIGGTGGNGLIEVNEFACENLQPINHGNSGTNGLDGLDGQDGNIGSAQFISNFYVPGKGSNGTVAVSGREAVVEAVAAVLKT